MTSNTAWALLSYYTTAGMIAWLGICFSFAACVALIIGFIDVCRGRWKGSPNSFRKPLWIFTYGFLFFFSGCLFLIIGWSLYPPKELLYHYLAPELKKEANRLYLVNVRKIDHSKNTRTNVK